MKIAIILRIKIYLAKIRKKELVCYILLTNELFLSAKLHFEVCFSEKLQINQKKPKKHKIPSEKLQINQKKPKKQEIPSEKLQINQKKPKILTIKGIGVFCFY